MVKEAETTDFARNALIPTAIKPAAGKLRLAPLMCLMAHFNLGGAIWPQQFLFGFQLVGTLCQQFTFPFSEKAARKRPLALSKLARSSAKRFYDRASRAGRKDSKLLRGGALEQQGKGWLSKSFPLGCNGKPFTLKGQELNIAFRFGVRQADKLRACDDLRHSMTNLACVALTPIKLASWDHLAAMCLAIRDSPHDWHLMKADHEAAYKQLPIVWEHSKLAVIAHRSPVDNNWYGFFSRTLMFGAISAVIHYNVFPRILSELTCRFLGIPMLSYFDDFGDLLPSSLAKKAIHTFSSFCNILGISL